MDARMEELRRMAESEARLRGGRCGGCGKPLEIAPSGQRYLVFCPTMGFLSDVRKALLGRDLGNTGHTEFYVGAPHPR